MLRFACNIYTPSFLGTPTVALDLLKALRTLPVSFLPTKIRTPHSPSRKFSFEEPGVFLGCLSQEPSYEGWLGLTKINGIFEFSVHWQKGNRDWFERHPTKPFNWIGFSSDRWKEASNSRHFPSFRNAFASLCEKFQAAFGSLCLEDPTKMDSPNGFGRCLPRLYWMTYLGKEYTKAMEERLGMPCEAFTLSHLSQGVLVQLACPAHEAIKQSAIERLAIEHLGADYFWNSKDNWRKPHFNYQMPDLDWSSVVTNS